MKNPKYLLPAEPKVSDLQLVFDDREKIPFDLERFGFRVIYQRLVTGDIAIDGMLNFCRLERKSLSDLVGTFGGGRGNFDEEALRLLAFPCRCVIVEASWADLEAGNWRSKITPKSVVGSVLGYIEMGLPFILAGSREKAEEYAAKLLFISARRRWRELRGLVANCVEEPAHLEAAT